MQAFIVVGQAPSKTGNPSDPLEGKIGMKMADLLGCTYDEYLAETQRFNILPEWPGSNAKGDKFPIFVARTNAFRMASSFGRCRVLVIGVAVGRCFGLYRKPLIWHRMRCISGEYRMAVLPHLSGINRWWNNDDNKRAARRFMRRTWTMVKR